MTLMPQIADSEQDDLPGQSPEAQSLESLAPQEFLDLGLEPLAAFAARARKLDASLSALEHVAGDATGRSVARLRQELAEFEPAITILGQVKAGKTTLVNAMAGWSDLLPSDVNPWTSVVTSLHLIPGPRRQEVGARFQLMKEDEWDRLLTKGGRLGELAQRADAGGELDKIRNQIETMREKSRRRLGRKFELLLGQEHEYGYFDRNLLERYVCLGDDFIDEDEAPDDGKQGWFADITRAADLYLNTAVLPYQMCIRDTPGVNDTFLMREQVTIGAVRDSRICVVVLSANQALTTVDMGLIRLISNLKSRDVIIFVNRIDELSDPATQVPEIEASIRDTLAKHQGPQDATILFGSGYWANKVLGETVEDIEPESAKVLMSWARARAADIKPGSNSAEMVWQLSGLSALNLAISERIVATLGEPLLGRIGSDAVSIAGGMQVANRVRLEGASHVEDVSLPEVIERLDSLTKEHTKALADNLATITKSYHERADRAHTSFLERATASLVKHLEDYGEHEVWQYDPTGLRLLLRSAYSVYAAHAQSAANEAFSAAVQDMAVLLYTSFGDVVEGIELAQPEAPEAPAPAALAQTIVLDFNDGWWVSWWRRTRGYKAFSEKFYSMIAGETQNFMAEFKTLPPGAFNAQLEGILQSFLEQCRNIAIEIGKSNDDKSHLQDVALSTEEKRRSSVIENVLADLKEAVGEPQDEAPQVDVPQAEVAENE